MKPPETVLETPSLTRREDPAKNAGDKSKKGNAKAGQRDELRTQTSRFPLQTSQATSRRCSDTEGL